jgi:hypothetical protein
MKLRRALMLALLLVLCPATAHAASPVLLGEGNEAGVGVDAAGTAYVAWVGNGADPTSLNYCRLPRGATACDVSLQITTPGTSLTRPFVTVSGSRVEVFSYRYGLAGSPFAAVYMFLSNDRGASFDAGRQVGTIAFFDAIQGPGDTVSAIADNSSIFQSIPADGSGPETREVHQADDHPYSPTVGLIDAVTPIAAFATGAGATQFRRYSGSGPLNDAASWTPAQDVSAFARYPRLASGAAGLVLQSDNSQGDIVVQKFDGSKFGAPVQIPGPAHELTGGSKDIRQDAAGRFHMVWPFGDASGNHLGYATSDDGLDWQTGTLESGPNPRNVAQAADQMRLAVAPDHVGVAVWHSGESPHKVYAITVGPVALALPKIGRTANAAVVKGKVLVKRKGSSKFVPLKAATQLPLGSTFDTTRGTVALDAAAGAGKPVQHGEFSGGLFTPGQSRKNPLVTVSLTGAGLRKCGRRLPPGGAPKKRSRTLFSSVKGHFRTRGRNSSATARGTKWTMTDSCGGTQTVVRSGVVVVRDFRLRKNKTLRSGQRYFAKAPPRSNR